MIEGLPTDTEYEINSVEGIKLPLMYYIKVELNVTAHDGSIAC